MACSNRSLGHEAGFATPTFAVLALCLALVTAASLSASDAELKSALRDWKREQALYALQGEATKAAWRLLSEPEMPTLRWVEASDLGQTRLTAEPEALKLSPGEAWREPNVAALTAVSGPTEGAALAQKLSAPASARQRPLERAEILAFSADPQWRRCGLTYVSPFSRLTRIALPAPRAPEGGGSNMHAGELWRISVESEQGWWIDLIIRFTGDPAQPTRQVEQWSGFSRARYTADCLGALETIRGSS